MLGQLIKKAKKGNKNRIKKFLYPEKTPRDHLYKAFSNTLTVTDDMEPLFNTTTTPFDSSTATADSSVDINAHDSALVDTLKEIYAKLGWQKGEKNEN